MSPIGDNSFKGACSCKVAKVQVLVVILPSTTYTRADCPLQNVLLAKVSSSVLSLSPGSLLNLLYY